MRFFLLLYDEIALCKSRCAKPENLRSKRQRRNTAESLKSCLHNKNKKVTNLFIILAKSKKSSHTYSLHFIILSLTAQRKRAFFTRRSAFTVLKL